MPHTPKWDNVTYFVYANDVLLVNCDLIYKLDRKGYRISQGYRLKWDEIRPFEGDTFDRSNSNSKCINVGPHGTVEIFAQGQRSARAKKMVGPASNTNSHHWVIAHVSDVSKEAGVSTGGSIFISARIHGN